MQTASQYLASLRRKHGADWRKHRRARLETRTDLNYRGGGLSAGMNGTDPVWASFDTGPVFRNRRYSDEIVGLNHEGWYSHPDNQETMRGFIERLPHGRFIAGYEWSGNGESVFYADLFDDEREATWFANGRAERVAEDEREYQTRWIEARNLESDIEDNEDKIRQLRAEHTGIVAARQSAPHHAELWAHKGQQIREEVTDLIESLRKDRELLKGYADVAE